MMFYLLILASHAIKGDVRLLELIHQVVAMMPHPSKPLAFSNSLGVDIEFRSPWNIFVGVPQASSIFAHPNFFKENCGKHSIFL
jgi:hypothetical protein